VPVALVTGATDGLGWHTARLLGLAGWTVLVHGRTPASAAVAAERLAGASGLGAYHPVWADFRSLGAVAELADGIAAGPATLGPDALVNNAGVLDTTGRQVTTDGHELHWGVNYLAAALLTSRLPGVRRVVSVGSTMPLPGGPRWDDLELRQDWDPRVAYAQSKLALAMLTLDVAAGPGAASAVCVSPGYVDTKLVRNAFGGATVPPSTAAAYIAAPLTDPDRRVATGRFIDRDRVVDPPGPAADAAARRRLAELTAGQLDLPPAPARQR
jgi:NAD(P)-dependent dehydrogenase (short-subunit alcohol dehydrogenase family)